MKERLKHALSIQLVRYITSTQAMPMMVLHGAWVLLALATWGHATGGEAGAGGIARSLVRAYAWLGGVDADGHGDAGNLMEVIAKLSLVTYAIAALWQRLFGAWRPLRWWLLALGSGALALVGYSVAMWPSLPAGGKPGDAAFVIGWFALLAAVSTAWAVLARRGGEWLIRSMERNAEAKRARRNGSCR